MNCKNTIKAINEYALSVINEGAISLEYAYYLKIDDEVRKMLVKHKVHFQPANTEGLYLPENELWNMVRRSEK